jgi:hypothetical protein
MTDEAMSPLPRRMIEDITIRKLAPKTQQGYIRTIKDFFAFLGRSPDTASLRTSDGFSCAWRRTARTSRFSIIPWPRCGSSSRSRSGAPTSSSIRRSSASRASCRLCSVRRRWRGCPNCQGAAAKHWLAAREADMLPVPYYRERVCPSGSGGAARSAADPKAEGSAFQYSFWQSRSKAWGLF